MRLLFMKRTLILAFLLTGVWQICIAQSQPELLAINFDNCVFVDESEHNRELNVIGPQNCTCSEDGEGWQLGGANDMIISDTSLDFNLAFAIGFLMKPNGALRNQQIIDWKSTCGQENTISISYDGIDNLLNVYIAETITKSIYGIVDLPENQCWYSIVVQKSGNVFQVYVNGEKRWEENATQIIELKNLGDLHIGNGPCPLPLSTPFIGVLDRIEIHNDFFTLDKIAEDAVPASSILTSDTLIFKGEEVEPKLRDLCDATYQWSPLTDIMGANLPNPIMSPEETILYYLNVRQGACLMRDSIRIIVADSALAACKELILPTAFTPNGDNLNDVFFISNAFSLEELIQFEIQDRWGGVVFRTNSTEEAWDGTVQGNRALPGVYVYKIKYICAGETKVQVGTLSVLN